MKIVIPLVILLFSLTLNAKTIYFNKNNNQVQRMEEFIVKHNKNKLTYKFNLQEAQLDKSEKIKSFNNLYKISHKTLLTTSEVGEAKKIFISKILIGKPSDFSISVKEGKGIYFNNKLTPSKPMPCRCSKDNDVLNNFKINVDSYRKSNQKFYKTEYLGDFRGIPLTRLTMYPLKTWGLNGFEVFPKISFKLSSLQNIKPMEDFSKLSDISTNKKYIIITPNKYKSSLKLLIDRRRKQGYEVQVFSLENIGTTFEVIKTFIHTLYQRDKFSYALLVGSEESFPTEYVPTSSSSETPSDLKYFTMGGAKDDVPDVFYGRFVVANETDIKNQIKKIIRYENKTFGNERGRGKIIGIASNEGYDPTDVEYIRKMHAPLVQSAGKTSIEFLQESSSSTVENINKAFSKGSMWVNYIGHGSGDSWSSIYLKEYNSANIKDIKVGGVTPVLIDVACQNGRFTIDNKLGERFMNETSANGEPIGAVAYYGGSVDISWHPPALMAVAISEQMITAKNKSLGSILLAGQMDLYTNYSDRQSSRENFVWYHLFGDPALQIDLK